MVKVQRLFAKTNLKILVLYNLSLHLIHCLPLSKWSSCRISPPILIGTRRYMYLWQRAMSQRRRISIYCKKESYRLLCESNRCIIISKKGDVQNENHQYQIRGFNLLTNHEDSYLEQSVEIVRKCAIGECTGYIAFHPNSIKHFTYSVFHEY